MMGNNNNAANPTQWVSLYADELYSYAMAKTGNMALAEDLVQETFLAGLSALPLFMGQSTERTWLYAILKNKIAGHYRKASTRYETKDIGDTGQAFLANFFDENGEWKTESKPTDWQLDNSNPIDDKEFAKILQGCIGILPKNWGVVFTLKYILEKKAEEVCKELNITASNYWVIIHRAKLQLRACIEKNWFNA